MKKILSIILLFIVFIIVSASIAFGAESVYPQKNVYPQENVYNQENPNIQDKYCDFNKVEELSRKCTAIYESVSAACPKDKFCDYSVYFKCHNELIAAEGYYMTKCNKNNKPEETNNVPQDTFKEETNQTKNDSSFKPDNVSQTSSGEWTNPFSFWTNPLSYIGAWFSHLGNSFYTRTIAFT